MSIVRKAGTTDVSVVIRIVDSTDGTPETGVVFDTAGIDLEYRREGAASVDITEATLAALTTAHTDGGFLHIGNGYYRLDLPDAACASGATGVLIHGTITGMIVIGEYIQLVAYDPFDTVRLGLTALPNAAADAAGGLPISDAGGLDLDAQRSDVAAILVDTGTTLDARIPSALGANGNMKADVLDLNGNNQSLLDLKDFADDGYNPSVNGIMLVDSVVSTGTVTGNVNGNVGGNVTGSVGSLATQAKADVQAEAEEALQTYHLDHLIASADPGGAVANSSFWARLHSKSATPAYSSYDNTTDSLEANRDNIGTAGAGLTIAGIAGTINTLDALDTAQDTQHSTSQSKLDTLLSVDRAYAKNVAVTGFVFPMLDTDGNPATGKAAVITAEISKDGGAFAAAAGAVSEISGGWYKVDWAQAEFNADEIALKFTASGCRQLNMKIRTQA